MNAWSFFRRWGLLTPKKNITFSVGNNLKTKERFSWLVFYFFFHWKWICYVLCTWRVEYWILHTSTRQVDSTHQGQFTLDISNSAWNHKGNLFQIKTNLQESDVPNQITKRILSQVSLTFDPIGFISRLYFKALFLQSLSTRKFCLKLCDMNF